MFTFKEFLSLYLIRSDVSKLPNCLIPVFITFFNRNQNEDNEYHYGELKKF